MRFLAISAAALLSALPLARAREAGGRPVALVTAETVNQLIAVDLPSGRVLRRLRMPADPENVAACASVVAVVSPRAGAVTLVDPVTLKVRRVLRGLGAPHIVACAPYGGYAYVTDDARGELVVIRGRVVNQVFVGYGAHHLAFSPDQPRLWIALGERAHSIAVVDTSDPARPRLVAHVHPRGLAHDLDFTPDGRRVWVTSGNRSELRIFASSTGRPVGTVSTGAPPQHLTFDPFSPARHAYVTSGNDGVLRVVSLRSGQTERVVSMPLGSFNVTAFGGFVVSASLRNGTLTELTDAGRIVLRKRLAPATRDVAVAVLP